jgi:hypothetical protein
MSGTLVIVFLSIIAVTALLQAGFVGALAYAARLGGRKLDEFEERFETTVVPQFRKAARLTDKAARLTEKTLEQALRVDDLVDGASRKAERHLDDAALRVEDAVETTVERVSAGVAARAARARENPIVRRLSSAAAFAKGVQRALEVWRATAEQDAHAYPDGMPPDEDDPADPSPA